jgi:uncharacterized RDD family membrane protein YckC
MTTSTGVYFRREDYASFWRRLIVDFIDAATVGLVCTIAIIGLWAFVPGNLILIVCVMIFFCHFVLLKRSKGGTLGYRMGGVRIVGLDGQRPGILALTIRMLFMVLGPINYLLDVVWLTSDEQRQALRDKFADTYVVRRGAEPVGSAKVVHRYYYILGYNFLFREVEARKAASVN